MIITSREQKLIQAFIKQGSLTIAEMLEITEPSRRTLYRDLEKLQNSLPSTVQLRTSENGYSLIGDLSQLTKVRKLIEYTMTERLTGELLLLIEQKASILSLTEQFAISQPTATSDLKKLEGMLKANGICLERDKGLKIKGNEEKIRSVLVLSLNSASQVSEILTGEIGKIRYHHLFQWNTMSKVVKFFQK